jgi:hypothetical protein
MSKVDTTVGQLVDMIQRGDLRLPEMQRRYVWTSTRVRDLLDSLYRGYPSGTILVWETDLAQATRDLAVSQKQSGFSGSKLLLDGQQRLTSLSAVIRGEPIKVRNRQRPVDIAFNLDHPEGLEEALEIEDDEDKINRDRDEAPDEESGTDENESSLLDRLSRRTFAVASKALLNRSNWISVTEVFKADKTDWQFVKPLVASPDDPNFAKYSTRLQRLRRIRDYPYVMHVLGRDLSYPEVAEIFVRVNSLGAKLRGSDLALAQITARWQGALALLEEFVEECEERWFTIDPGLLVRQIVVFATERSRFSTVGGISLDRLKESWDKTKEGLRFAINFLRTNADIEDETLLSSPAFMIPIAVYGTLKNFSMSQQDESDMLRWLYTANARGHYSGSSESTLDADLALLFGGSAFGSLMSPLIQRFGRLHVEASDLKGKGQRSALFSLAYLALKHAGAKDWKTGLGLSLTHQGVYHYIEFHHIFPKSLLQRAQYEKGEINEIANMAFVSGRVNRNISNRRPVDYFPLIVKDRGEQALRSQGIPTDKKLWEIECYRDFLDARRKALAAAINKFVESASGAGRALDIGLDELLESLNMSEGSVS